MSPSPKFNPCRLFLVAALAGTAMAAPLKVDLSYPNRNDTAAPHFVEWPVVEAAQISRDFDGVTVTFTKLSPAATTVRGQWYKGGIDYPALMATDGLSGEGGGVVEMTIAGLAPGPHTLVTYHNTFDNPATNSFSDLNITLNGAPHVTGFQTSNRVLTDYDAPSVFYEFTVSSGQTVTLTFDGDGTGSNDKVIINGFEIDTVDPADKAIKPVPANDDEHVDGDDGDVQLSWTPAAGAVSHDVYYGLDAGAVDAATQASDEFQGNQSGTTFMVSNLSNFDEYYWRVDEVDGLGARTKGELWRFRIRHQAFPTAEGYGRFARGGRGGIVYEVTNLNDSGPGSLREGIENLSGPRTIVFNISGRIVLQSKLVLRDGYCTVAGQTAPGMGICISNYTFGMLGTQDGIIRFIRTRPGNTSGTTIDGMGMASANHSIVDHCSISWTIDEAFSSRSAKNITLQRCLIAEALNVSGHQNYPAGTRHGYAASIGGEVGSFHHNLLAHCEGRNWSLAGGLNNANVHRGRLDIRNNVVYNWRSRTTDGGAAEVNFVRNYYKPGPATEELDELNPDLEAIEAFGPQRYYVEGNVMEGVHGPEGPNPPFQGVDPGNTYPTSEYIVTSPFFEPYVATHSAADAYSSVLADVGCNVPALDSLDIRYINETQNGTFTYYGSATNEPGLIDSQADVGGWPAYPVESRLADWDTDHDGLPNFWEDARGYLDSDNPEDRNGDYNHDGYTNLEDYLNFLAGDIAEPPTTADVWVNFSLTPGGDGSQANPFNLLADGVATVDIGGTLHLAGSTATPAVISKPMRLVAEDGNARIGGMGSPARPVMDSVAPTSRNAVDDWLLFF